MPWQAHLWIGVPVANEQDVRTALVQLGRQDLAVQARDGADIQQVFDNAQPRITIPVRLEHGNLALDPPDVEFRHEHEGGCGWPVPADETYTDTVVGFQITSRYRPTLLDASHPHGRPEPFVIDIEACRQLLSQVQKHWPDARLLIWDMWF